MKEKLRLHIGTPVDHQRLVLKDSGHILCQLADDTKMLGYYSVTSGMEIHIVDTDPYSLSRNGGLTDVSLVQKYKMSDEDYSTRKGTMRSYIQEQRAKNPNFKLKPKGAAVDPAPTEPPPDASTVEGITVGARCKVAPGGRRGTVRFVGEIPTSTSGYWVENLAKNLLFIFYLRTLRLAWSWTSRWERATARRRETRYSIACPSMEDFSGEKILLWETFQ